MSLDEFWVTVKNGLEWYSCHWWHIPRFTRRPVFLFRTLHDKNRHTDREWKARRRTRSCIPVCGVVL